MGLPLLQSVVVTLRASGPDRAADREALLAAVASATGVDVAAVRAGRVCPHCAATDHGRPWAEVDGSAVGVSLARTTDLVALAVGPPGIGVDLERVSRVAAAPLDAFTPGELARSGDATARAACWAVKEAVLKRDGRGLRVDPSRVEVDLVRGAATLDGAEQPVTVVFPGEDLVLAVAAGGVPVSVGA
ncbi:4'-phosphopantetheinyl transferase family protein [Curtobacterium sp. NPDC098951]|uniref:4'-phosphopantetheinyl transferase family protein n=1 Tax=Curtobacterium sp. NPDC098951 TaxID=3363974 RepID=UPI0038194FA4